MRRLFRRRAQLEAELHFWRNYAALTRFSLKRPRVTVPAQRTRSPADERWEGLLRAAYKHPHPRR